MLTDADKESLGKRTQKAVEELELELLEVAADQISDLDEFDSYEIASGVRNVSIGAAVVSRKKTQGIINAVKKDLEEEFELNGRREAQIAQAAGREIPNAVITKVVSDGARTAFKAVSEQVVKIMQGTTRGTVNAYVTACERAAVQVSRVGTDNAMKQAITFLAERGITSSSYTRKDGVTVNVPVDVGIRRAMVNAGQRGRMAQTLAIADAVGHDLVEVNVTANARESHAEWQGEIYSLSGKSKDHKEFNSSCNVGDPIDGIGGYNCGHEVAMYYEEYGKTFSDPLEGTGYTTEEVRELTARQRELERGIRADKRVESMLSAKGFSTGTIKASIREKQQALDRLVSNNKQVLFRSSSREKNFFGSSLFIPTAADRRVVSSVTGLNMKEAVKASDILSGEYRANLAKINSAKYDRVAKKAVGGALAKPLANVNRTILRHRNGTAFEDLYYIDATSGKVIGRNIDTHNKFSTRATEKMKEKVRAHIGKGKSFVAVHNHPRSSLPSYDDFESLKNSGAAYGIIACHDGSIIKFGLTEKTNLELGKSLYDNIMRRVHKNGEPNAVAELEQTFGVRIERFE